MFYDMAQNAYAFRYMMNVLPVVIRNDTERFLRKIAHLIKNTGINIFSHILIKECSCK